MTPATITLIIFACAVALFVSDVLPMGLVVFSVPLALCFTGVIRSNCKYDEKCVFPDGWVSRKGK